MQTERTLALEQELWERVGPVARDEGKTVDELTAEALTRDPCSSYWLVRSPV